MITLENINNNLAEAIKKSGLTQVEIAERVGVRQQQISCYMCSQKTPGLDTFARICKALDLDPADILCLND